MSDRAAVLPGWLDALLCLLRVHDWHPTHDGREWCPTCGKFRQRPVLRMTFDTSGGPLSFGPSTIESCGGPDALTDLVKAQTQVFGVTYKYGDAA